MSSRIMSSRARVCEGLEISMKDAAASAQIKISHQRLICLILHTSDAVDIASALTIRCWWSNLWMCTLSLCLSLCSQCQPFACGISITACPHAATHTEVCAVCPARLLPHHFHCQAHQSPLHQHQHQMLRLHHRILGRILHPQLRWHPWKQTHW